MKSTALAVHQGLDVISRGTLQCSDANAWSVSLQGLEHQQVRQLADRHEPYTEEDAKLLQEMGLMMPVELDDMLRMSEGARAAALSELRQCEEDAMFSGAQWRHPSTADLANVGSQQAEH